MVFCKYVFIVFLSIFKTFDISADRESNRELRDLIKSLQESWEGIDLAGLQEQVLDNKAAIEEIQEYLKSVPNTRITEDEINELE